MTDLSFPAEQQIRERLPHARESGVGFSWRSVELLLAALDAERARADKAEAEARNRDHGGVEPSVERIMQAHSRLPIKWLGSPEQSGHPLYRQSHDEACFICAIWNHAEALEAVAEAARVYREHTKRTPGLSGGPEGAEARRALDAALAVLEEPQ